MEDYVEEYKYSDCFWGNQKTLYTHSDNKLRQFISIGKIIQKLSQDIFGLQRNLNKFEDLYKKPDEPNYSREDGIEAFFSCIKVLTNEFNKFAKILDKIYNEINIKKDVYESQRDVENMRDEACNKYNHELDNLNDIKKSYFDSINNYVEAFLNKTYNKKENSKMKHDLENKLKIVETKKKEYTEKIEEVERLRLEYMDIQGNLFAVKQDFEIGCTDDLKNHFKSCIKIFEDFFKNFKISDKDKEKIENIDGEKDTKNFAKNNRSFVTGPKRHLYKEYPIDLNYYVENFEVIKNLLKNKNQKEQREIKKRISNDVTNLLEPIVREKPDDINQNVEQIAKDIKENRLSEVDFKYLIQKFQDNYDTFYEWKEKFVHDQEYKKIGKEWDERFCYMHTFLKYFNKKRIENKELNEENFNYLCQAIFKILELNDHEDIDYNLCDLIVILSSTFYSLDKNDPNKKIYVNEVIRKAPLLQKQGFWVRLTKYELNEEIQRQKKIEDTLKENNDPEEKLNNSVIAKLMSVSYNIMQFVLDSNLFNKILSDIFKFCKINQQNRQIVVDMMENQIKGDNITYLKLNKEMLLSCDDKGNK